jgi:hypothetical protein
MIFRELARKSPRLISSDSLRKILSKFSAIPRDWKYLRKAKGTERILARAFKRE